MKLPTTVVLTLRVEEKIIAKAKSYAKQTGRSLSELVENYLHTLTTEDENVQQVSPKPKKIVGAVKLLDDFDEEREYRKLPVHHTFSYRTIQDSKQKDE